ncbi:hypothetical protein FQ087_18435 [Sporosarcina sp. ANT_H38]|nr:hypothetical protein FQ087_18435 [Sporosarcina sp. ANT_H38]
MERNFATQYYKGIPLKQIDRGYGAAKARRFVINGTSHNCWIPNKHLELDGTIKHGQDLDYIVVSEKHAFRRAGVRMRFEVSEVRND